MKKFVIICFLSVFAISSSSAGPLSYGFKGGFNFSNLSGSAWDTNSNYKTSFHAGAFLDLSLIRLIHIETGAYYSRKGFVEITKIDENTIAREADYSFNYIDIPLLVHFKPIPFITFYLGPQASLLLNDKSVIIDADGQESSDPRVYDYTGMDYSLVLGTRTLLPFGLLISASYDIGLMPLYTEGQNINHRVFKVSLGYRL